MPGVVAVIQTFGNRINFHPHIHAWLPKEAQRRMVFSTVSPAYKTRLTGEVDGLSGIHCRFGCDNLILGC
jgi:hypothetical protein